MKAIIFDMDGTLIDSETDHAAKSLSKHYKKIIPNWDQSDFHKMTGFGILQMYEFIQQKYNLKMNFEEFNRYALDGSNAMYRENAKLMLGVHELLTTLKSQKIPMAVATSNHSQNVKSVFEKLQISNFFVGFISEDMVNHRAKPHPDVYLEAANLLGFHPQETLSIEDSHVGIQSAKSAGTICLGYTNSKKNPQNLTDAHHVFDDFKSLTPSHLFHLYNSLLN